MIGTLKERIGLVQIPHHGSIENTDTAIFDLFSNHTMIFFMSYGIGNKYGHPSQYLIDMLETRCNRVVEVTQEKRYVEMIEIG
jgi:beta-lactamase superfamily II metal-dependent hydrolase